MSRLKKRRPQREHLPLIRKTRDLIRGRDFVIDLPDLGVRASGRLYWEQDRSPDIDTVSYEPLPRTPRYFKHLLKLDRLSGTTLLHEDVCEEVIKSAPFRQMKKEILVVCRESDKIEAANPDFDWIRDVLDFAEK